MIKAGYGTKQHIHFIIGVLRLLLIFLVLVGGGKQPLRAQYYPIHATVHMAVSSKVLTCRIIIVEAATG